MNLELKKVLLYSFTISSDKVCVFVKRETGKSFLVKDLLYYHKSIPISNSNFRYTESANSFLFKPYSWIFFIHDAYTPEIINNALLRQKMVIKKIKEEKSRYNECNIFVHF